MRALLYCGPFRAIGSHRAVASSVHLVYRAGCEDTVWHVPCDQQLYPQPPNPSLSFPRPPSLFCFISGTELNLAHSSAWGKISALVHAWQSLAFQSSPPFLFRHCWYSGNVFEVVSVSYCCCNTWPHMGWLKTTQIYYLTAPEVRIPRGLTKLESSVDRVVFLWEA